MDLAIRIIADVFIFIGIFIFPWWLTLPLILVGIFYFRFFYESLFLGFLMDGFLGVSGVSLFGTNSLFTLICSLVFIISLFLKSRLKFY